MAFKGCREAAAVTAAVLVLIEIIAPLIGATPPHETLPSLLSSPLGMTTIVIVLIAVDARERTIVLRLALGAAVLSGGLALALRFPVAEAAGIGGVAIPLVTAAYLVFRIVRTAGAERSAYVDLLAAASIIALCAPTMLFCLELSAHYFNPIYDALYIRIDELFGVQPAAVVAYLFRDFPPLGLLCGAVYLMLPMAQATVAGLEARNPRGTPGLGILPGFLATAVIGYALYAIMPAIGPLEYLGHAFPMLHIGRDYLTKSSEIDTNQFDLRGAMPSLHITWATLLFLATRRMRQAVQVAAGAFLLLTFLATLGLGMHYLIDLIVAAPLIVLIRALIATDLPWRTPERLTAIASGAVLIAMWVAISRAEIDVEAARAFVYAAIAATLLVPLIVGLRLERRRAEPADALQPVPVLAPRYPQMPSLTQ